MLKCSWPHLHKMTSLRNMSRTNALAYYAAEKKFYNIATRSMWRSCLKHLCKHVCLIVRGVCFISCLCLFTFLRRLLRNLTRVILHNNGKTEQIHYPLFYTTIANQSKTICVNLNNNSGTEQLLYALFYTTAVNHETKRVILHNRKHDRTQTPISTLW